MFVRGKAASLTSNMDEVKTNEFQTLRRLRLQQVRDQSKKIARDVRERVNKERSRHLERETSAKREDYIDRQTRLVERLERHHANVINSVGLAHSLAAEEIEKDKQDSRPLDHSKIRGKIAAEELKKLKQEELNKKKEHLDRKLIARNLANERSRTKLIQKQSNSKDHGDTAKLSKDITEEVNVTEKVQVASQTEETNIGEKCEYLENGVQTSEEKEMDRHWSTHDMKEWGEDTYKPPEMSQAHSFDANKRTNLFEISDSMPESLLSRIRVASRSEETQDKPSVTLVTEFLKTRDFRLQKPKPGFHRISDKDLLGLRDTLANAKRLDSTQRGSDICQVVDDTEIPVPSWEPAPNCSFCRFHFKSSLLDMETNSGFYSQSGSKSEGKLRSQRTDISIDINSGVYPFGTPSNSVNQLVDYSAGPSRACIPSKSLHALNKKHSVLHYDHTTKTTRDLPLDNDKLVERVVSKDLDAYTLAMREGRDIDCRQRDSDVGRKRKMEAVARERVAQEYQDTLAFLRNEARTTEKEKPIKTAYMDDYQQNRRKTIYQKQLEKEFERVQKCSKPKATISSLSPDKYLDKKKGFIKILPGQDLTTSAQSSLAHAQELLHKVKKVIPSKNDDDWMPYVEQNEARTQERNGSTVTFDFNPSYTYIPRNKHTPPTKDKPDARCDETPPRGSPTGRGDDADKSVDDSVDTLVSNCSSDSDVPLQTPTDRKPKVSKTSKVKKYLVYKFTQTSDTDTIGKIKSKKKKTRKSSECLREEVNTKDCDPIDTESGKSNGNQRVEFKVCAETTPHRVEPSNSSSTSKDKEDITDNQPKKLYEWDISGIASKRTTEPSAANSAATFKTAQSDKSHLPGSFVKVIDEEGAEAGKFFIGTRLPQETPYEVIIQLKTNSKPSNDKAIQSSSVDLNEPILTDPQLNKPKSNIQNEHVCSCHDQNKKTPEKHYSSSSSTIYMSPPELVLPNFLKSYYRNMENFRLGNNFNIEKILKMCQDNDNKINEHKTHETIMNCEGTARSHGELTELISNKSTKIKSPCPELEPEVATVNSAYKKKYSKKKKQIIKPKIHQYQQEIHEMLSNYLGRKINTSDGKTKSKLSPLLREYITNLLEMADSDSKMTKFSEFQCSSVTTPCSSIMNEPTNNHSVWTVKSEDILQAKINEIVQKNLRSYLKQPHSLLNAVETNSNKVQSKLFSTKKVLHRKTFTVPKLQLHKQRQKNNRVKLKSLNISKNLLKYFETIPPEEAKKSVYLRKCTSNSSSQFTKCPESVESKHFKTESRSKLNQMTIQPNHISDHKKRKNLFNQSLKKLNSDHNNPISGCTSEKGKSPNKPVFRCSKSKCSKKSIIQSVPIPVKKHVDSKPNLNKDTINSENLIHIAKEKLHNMEKITNLTEKCTKRLSNLAKVLDVVRKNKSNMYQEITSPLCPCPNKHEYSSQTTSEDDIQMHKNRLSHSKVPDNSKTSSTCTVTSKCNKEKVEEPQNDSFRNDDEITSVKESEPDIPQLSKTIDCDKKLSPKNNEAIYKYKTKPPPALCQVNFLNDENIVPHELSTVLEVDTPLSNHGICLLKNKLRSPCNTIDPLYTVNKKNDNLLLHVETSQMLNKSDRTNRQLNNSEEFVNKENLNLGNESENSKPTYKPKTKHKGLRINNINEPSDKILKPFITIEEFARKYKSSLLEETSKIEDKLPGTMINENDEDLSNSDGTLPDIISELLKKKIISKPFDFEDGTNADSNELSSESNISIVTTPHAIINENKVNLKTKFEDVDISDSLSISSKHDYEKTFKDLGMGWASSTLKKTKASQALSSSTSSTSFKEPTKSCRKNKRCNFAKKTLPLSSDTNSKCTNIVNVKETKDTNTVAATSVTGEHTQNCNKLNVELQTSLASVKHVSVKEFLTNSLADKITFSDKTQKSNESNFTSLYSTKLTDISLKEIDNNNKSDEELSKRNSRQRTSTPVQIFKSLTYNSSTSSYNASNGFFSNIDDISSVKNGSGSEKDELTIPNLILKIKKCKSDSSES